MEAPVSATPQDEDALRVEFETLARRAGLEIPPERRDRLFEGFLELKGMVDVLHRPREAVSEVEACLDPRIILRAIP